MNLMLILLVASAYVGNDEAEQRPIFPPVMSKRSIAPRGTLPGTSETLTDGDRQYTLFVPESWKPKGEFRLAFHFHGAIWHAIQEHVDRGLGDPLIAYYPGEGSLIYQRTFEDRERLGRWIEAVRSKLIAKGMSERSKLQSIDMTSFSAGYGAIREIIRSERYFALTRRVVLGDSLYGGLEAGTSERVPAKTSIDPWLPLAKAAMERRKSFAITVSEVATPTYASSSECAEAIVKSVGGSMTPVEKGDCAATLDNDFPLLRRFDRGAFHVWWYGGSDGQAHMTHARHIADVWKALGKPPSGANP